MPQDRTKSTLNLISIDGGGIRGVFAITLIDRLLTLYPSLLKNTYLIAGTSTGGILALGLANGMTPKEIRKLYEDNGEYIFHDSFWDDVKDMGGLVGADYSNKNLKATLKKYFGNLKLKDLSKKVLIPTFNLYDTSDPDNPTWKPKFYHNFDEDLSDAEQLVVDVAMMTSAAPSFFPTYNKHIDGGVVANNPSMAALAQVLDERYKLKVKLSSINILNISTGFNPAFIEMSKDKDWGATQWVRPLINIMIDGAMDVSAFYCRQVIKDNFHRVSLKLPKSIKMDNYKAVPYLIKLAESVNLTDTIKWLQGRW
jgi:patatin-like phospholipase/acyl hydrolase